MNDVTKQTQKSTNSTMNLDIEDELDYDYNNLLTESNAIVWKELKQEFLKTGNITGKFKEF